MFHSPNDRCAQSNNGNQTTSCPLHHPPHPPYTAVSGCSRALQHVPKVFLKHQPLFESRKHNPSCLWQMMEAEVAHRARFPNRAALKDQCSNFFTRWIAILSRIDSDESSLSTATGRQHSRSILTHSCLLDKIWEQREVLCIPIPRHRVDFDIPAMLIVCATPHRQAGNLASSLQRMPFCCCPSKFPDYYPSLVLGSRLIVWWIFGLPRSSWNRLTYCILSSHRFCFDAIPHNIGEC